MARLWIYLECPVIHSLQWTFVCLLLFLNSLTSLLSSFGGDGVDSFPLVASVVLWTRYSPQEGLISLVRGICSGINMWLKLEYLPSFLEKIFYFPWESELGTTCGQLTIQWREKNWEWSLDEKEIEPWLYFNCYIPSHHKIHLELE